MDPVITPIVISAGVTAAREGFNTSQTNKRNEKQMAFEREMYAKEIADKERFWHMQNAYNSPEQQMERLRQAGLNPNLVYGRGADNTAQSISSTQTGRPNLIAPQIQTDPMMLINQFQQIKKQQAEIEGININNDIQKQMWWQAYYDTQLAADKFGVRRGTITGAGGNEAFARWVAGEIAGSQKPVVDVQQSMQTYGQNQQLFPYEKAQAMYQAEKAKYDAMMRKWEVETNEQRKQVLANELQAQAFQLQMLEASARWAEMNANPLVKMFLGLLSGAGAAAMR